ncbi:MAG: CehA/McbA family metallohydrolase [Fuerstiella sp.]
MTRTPLLCLVMLLIVMESCGQAGGDPLVVTTAMHHLRNAEPREWDSFPIEADSTALECVFQAAASQAELTLRLRQQDVKQAWDIRLNDQNLGRLHRDENAIDACWAIPAGTLVDGENRLLVSSAAKQGDDIRVGQIQVLPHNPVDYLGQSRLTVTVRDEDTGELTPCRVTVLHDDHLMMTSAASNDDMAVRPGVIYCRGTAEFGLPPGTYRIVAGRGPEFSIDQQQISLAAGTGQSLELTIRREVPSDGLVACDTHVHTLTHSGHGDATVRERLLTLAGEGIELPIATDHNKHIDYEQLATELQVRRWFTPVIGNEVTTKIGHFNVFPVASSDVPVPDHTPDNWSQIFDNIFATPDVCVVILNHARDIHSNYRPFGPAHHLSLTGQNLDGWDLRANAMEIINSAAQQTDMMQLVRDWMGQLSAGRMLTPVGSSDSHDVARHFPGQGRTLIRCDDSEPGKIDVAAAVRSFLAGKVTVSCGLMADIRVNDLAGSGDVVPMADHYRVVVNALGPSWIEARHVEIFVNGQSVHTATIDERQRRQPGIKATVSADLPIPAGQDSFVVAVVRGPGVTGLHWPLAKPYQPTSESWVPECMAVTGAVWIDADGDDRVTSARRYAEQICEAAAGDPNRVVAQLAVHDAAVAVHAASILHDGDSGRFVAHVLPATGTGPSQVRRAFQEYLAAWRASERARVQR